MPPKLPDPPRPTAAELEILTVLWSRGPSTVRDVHETISSRKPTQYTTVLKLLQIMAEKGLVRRDQEYQLKLARLRTAIDEGRASGIRSGAGQGAGGCPV